MKKKILAMSLLTIIMCVSLIVGATFAMFTSESSVNIAVTSGRVEVVAAVDQNSVSLYSPSEIGDDGTIVNEANAAGENTFANGGTAAADESGLLTFTDVAPGDRVTFEIDITNHSNVAYRQRLTFSLAEGSETLYRQLLVGVGTENGQYTYYGSRTAWESKTADTQAETLYVSAELPAYTGNSAQDKSCSLQFTVEAVQGNASVSQDAADPIHIVESAAVLTELFNGEPVKDGDKIVLGGSASAWAEEDFTVSFDDAKTLYFSGYKFGTMTVNAENGTVYVFNDANSIVGAKVADESLHVYGSVSTLTVNSGRAVVEEGAAVGTVKALPSEIKNTPKYIKASFSDN